MITKITDNNLEEYVSLFNDVSNALTTFIKEHITNASDSNGKTIFTVNSSTGEITFSEDYKDEDQIPEVGEVNINEAASSYIYYNMGKPDSIDLKKNPNIAKDICQAYLDVGRGSVTGLEEYFGIIKTLRENLDTNYGIIPLDEATFDIDANTRTIKLPKNDYTYIVKGDNLAETIFFTIDRYFDGVDLNSKEIVILSSINGNKSWTPITLKDITSINGKIKFGWTIGTAITQESGTLEFSVRFIDLTGNTFDYSFSTLPAKISIKHTLDFVYDGDGDTDEVIHYDDSSDKLKDLFKNNDIHGTAAISAPNVYYPLKEEIIQLEYDEEESEWKSTNIKSAAYSPDALDVSYSWLQHSENSKTFNPVDKDLKEGEFIEVSEPTKEDVKAYGLFYYTIGSQETPSPESFVTLSINSSGNIEGRPASVTKWFRKGSQHTVDKAGSYVCQAIVKRGLRIKSTKSKLITVPHPSNFEMSKYSTNTPLIYHFRDGESFTSNTIRGELSKEDIIKNNYEISNTAYHGIMETKLEKAKINNVTKENYYILSRNHSLNNAETGFQSFSDEIIIYPPLDNDYLIFTAKINENNEYARKLSWKKADNYPEYIDCKVEIIDFDGKVSEFTSTDYSIDTSANAQYAIKVTYTSKYKYLTPDLENTNNNVVTSTYEATLSAGAVQLS